LEKGFDFFAKKGLAEQERRWVFWSRGSRVL